MSEKIHPQDRPDSRDWEPPVDRNDDPPTRGSDVDVPYTPPPSPSYGWTDSAELHGDETGGQEP